MLRQVRTENGIVRGIEAADPRITAFKGIPFAAPPIGKNRWRAPQPCESWAGVRDCSRFAPISMQWIPGLGDDIYCREWHVDPEIPMGEDCLYLNVWTKAKKADEKMPVLVWFFGGGLQCGYPAEMEFDGERIARRGIVVVTAAQHCGLRRGSRQGDHCRPVRRRRQRHESAGLPGQQGTVLRRGGHERHDL